jgi:hypothetical protein
MRASKADMKLRLAPVVVALLLALAGADSATAVSAGPEATASAKKCKRPKARYKGRCVRRCPAGYVKKPSARWGRKCVPRRPTDGVVSEPLFAKPSGELTGNDAFNHFSRYFLNSRFTDCPAGWPNCAVEERYDHCSSGAWAYHRYTPTSGSDINSYGNYQVTGAVAHPDGSWGVEYHVYAYSTDTFYSWDVASNGTVLGRYWGPGTFPPDPPSQNLGPLQWKQPTDCGA